MDTARWTPLHLPVSAAAGWKTNSHPADCFHRCQASRPTEPFGKVNRKLSSQIKNAPNDQSQVTTLLLQKEVYDCEKAYLQSGATKITITAGLNFLLSPPFTVRSRVDSKQAMSLHHQVYFYTSTFSLCLCVFNSDVIKELLETGSHQPHVLKKGGGERARRDWSLKTTSRVCLPVFQ